METVIRDNLFEKEFDAEVFWFNCQVCGDPLMEPLGRSLGFCSGACLEADRAARRAAKKAKLRRMLKLEGATSAG